MEERSIYVLEMLITDQDEIYILMPKKPMRRMPIVRRLKPTVNWLPLLMVGTNGLAEAPFQTSCSDCSIKKVELLFRGRYSFAKKVVRNYV